MSIAALDKSKIASSPASTVSGTCTRPMLSEIHATV